MVHISTLLGLFTLWLGSIVVADGVLTGEFTGLLGFFENALGGVLISIAGVGFVVRDIETPSDTGEKSFHGYGSGTS